MNYIRDIIVRLTASDTSAIPTGLDFSKASGDAVVGAGGVLGGGRAEGWVQEEGGRWIWVVVVVGVLVWIGVLEFGGEIESCGRTVVVV